MDAKKLNETSDEVLSLIVEDAMNELNGNERKMSALAPFVTLHILHRLHEGVVCQTRAAGSTGCSFSKHKMLAAVIFIVTGAKLLPDHRDLDKIGNHLDIWLKRRFTDMDRKLRRKQNPTIREEARTQLREQCFAVTAWGGVETYDGPFLEVDSSSEKENNLICPTAQMQPHVPFTRTRHLPSLGLLDLHEEAQLARSEATFVAMELQREKLRLIQAKRKLDDGNVKVAGARKLAAKERRERQEEASRAAEAKRAHQDLKEKHAAAAAAVQLALQRATEAEAQRKLVEHEAAKERQTAAADLLRLGSQAARATQEAGVFFKVAQRERELKRQAEARAAAEVELLRAQAAEEEAERKRVERQAAKERQTAAADLLRLGSQAARATQEAGVFCEVAQRERELKRQAEARAAAEAELLRAQAAEEEAERKRVERQAAKELQISAADVFRLGSRAARAAQEAGVFCERALQVEAKLIEAQAQLHSAEEQRKTLAEEKRQLRKDYTVLRGKSELVKATSKKRLDQKKALEARVCELLQDREALLQEVEQLRQQCVADEDARKKLSLMPSWRHKRGKGKRGGSSKLEHQHRVAILEQHANGTPSSAIGRNIVSVVKAAAPWLEPVQPTTAEIRKIGFELPTIEEALSARKVASAYSVRLLGFDETTDTQEPSITSNVQIQPTAEAPLEDCVLKAAYLSTKGGRSEAIVEEVEGKCFARLRELLQLWQAMHKRMFPDIEWTGPDPNRCSLHRLAGGGAIMSDTCNAARKAKRLMRSLIQEQAVVYLRNEMGDAAWDALAEEAKAGMLRVHLLDCHQHMRNVILNHMSRKQADYVKAELAEPLKQFSSWERMTTDYDQLLRAVYKEFHQGGRYYKGKGAEFSSWMLENHPSAFYMHIERADGGRQDLDYDAAVPIYINRPLLVEYLHTVVFNTGHKNVLEDFLYTTCRTLQFVAMSRANAVIDLRISRPMRWLAGMAASLQDWSPYQNNQVLDLVYDIFLKAKDDGAVLLAADLDVFEKIALEQPLFREYLDYTFSQDSVLSPDGRTRHFQYKLALQEALEPADETNKLSHDKTVEYIQIQCAAALEKMEDAKLAIADKLTSHDGANSFEKQTTAHTDVKGCQATNDAMAESVFGAYKYERRRLPGISQRRASGLAQARLMKSLSHADAVQRRAPRISERSRRLTQKRWEAGSTGHAFGYFHKLPHTEAVALVEMARAERRNQRKLDRSDYEELDAFRAARRQSNSELELESLVKQYALGLSFFDRYKERGVRSCRGNLYAKLMKPLNLKPPSYG